MAAYGGIRQCRRKIRRAAVLLTRIRHQVPPQTVIEGQLAADFPGILREPGIESPAAARFCRLRDSEAVHRSQQQARVGETGEESPLGLSGAEERVVGLVR